jgi:hypothetical protein
MAKPTATGVNELRPADQNAAHQAASTTSPDARPTPIVSPSGASGSSRPTIRATHIPNTRHPPPISSPRPIDSQTSPLAIVMTNSSAS